MKTAHRFAIVATLAMSAVAAQAQGLDFGQNNYPPEVKMGASLTRAQVQADVTAAVANGSMPIVGDAYREAQTQQSTLTRTQVREQTANAVRAGQTHYNEG